MTQSTRVAYIWLHSIDSQQYLTLLLEPGFDPLLIGQVQSDELFVTLQQICHRPLGNAYSALDQALVDLRDRTMLSIA